MRGLISVILKDANAAGYLSKTSVLKSIFVDAGFLTVVIYRFQSYFSKPGFYLIAKVISRLNLLFHGSDFVIGSKIGSGLVIKHPVGIVVGNKVVCGTGLSLMQGVTLGQKSFHSSRDQDTLNPVIGDDVKIGVGAILLGGINVGSRVTIAAGTLLISDVPADTFVVGNPSKIVRKNST
jgi:serine O-acetyltransferase